MTGRAGRGSARLAPARPPGRLPRRLHRAALAVLALGAAGLLSWLLLASAVLGVDRVQVTGAVRAGAAEVVRAADVPVGQPLARVDAGAVRERVRRLAPVADVDVERVWPGTLAVRVTERQPVAATQLPGRRWQLVDREGVPFAVVRAQPRGTVRLRVRAPGPAVSHAPTAAALQVLADLPEDLRRRVDAVTARSPSAVTLALRERRTVVWGAVGDTEVKAGTVRALLQRPGSVIDVSSPSVAVVRA